MLAEIVDAFAPPGGQLLGGFGRRDARHRQQEARIDAVVAGRDAGPAHDARAGPFASGFRAAAAAQEIDDAADDGDRIGIAEAGGLDARTGGDAFAAARAGIDHLFDATL